MSKKVETNNRLAANVKLVDFCVFANTNDWMEVTEWSNGEGVDIEIYTEKGEEKTRIYRFSHGEFNALKKCIKSIENIK